jgi:hypothetical protein
MRTVSIPKHISTLPLTHATVRPSWGNGMFAGEREASLGNKVHFSAADKPLSATNKPLSAVNKPLSAANKPLYAVNKPLSAANKHLYAVNKPL